MSGNTGYKNVTGKYKETKKEHILACLSSAPSNGKIIRTAARMADAFGGQFTALFVETPDFTAISVEDKKRLQENQQLAEQLGANIEIVYGEDVAYQIAEFARRSGITKIVLGRSVMTRRALWGKPPLTEQLISYVPQMDIHIIPDKSSEAPYRQQKVKTCSYKEVLINLQKTAGILLSTTLLNMLFHQWKFTDSNLILVYILGVLLTSVVTSHLIYSLASSLASVILFNYLFTVPRFSFAAYETGYPVTFVVMFLTAFITGTLAGRYKKQAAQSAKIAWRNKILFDTNQLLSKAGNKEEILTTMAEQIVKLLGRNIVLFERENGKLQEPRFWSAGKSADQKEKDLPSYHVEKEKEIAQKVLETMQLSGNTAQVISDTGFVYLKLHVNERVYGVIGIEAEQNPLDASEHSILRSILGEGALALENEKNHREKEAAAVWAEREQLRANLLRTISHDLRTPLTTISGNASSLLYNGADFDIETRNRLYSDIYEDSIWLINLVENLLSATRIEDGRMTLRTSTELVSDIVEEALHHVERKMKEHSVSVIYQDELLLVKADAKLIVQVLVNLLDNAVKYTPSGSKIILETRKKDGMAEILISDNGDGIPDEEKNKIFEKFYCGGKKIADKRRSLGLGLYLCKAIVNAHGGTIYVTDAKPSGAVFGITLPLEEVILHE